MAFGEDNEQMDEVSSVVFSLIKLSFLLISFFIVCSQFSPFIEENIYDTFQNMALQFDDVINECIWQGKIVNCSMHMDVVFTEKGLCFAFNGLNSNEIYTDE